MMRPWSLATRLTAWYAATAFLLVTGAAVVQYRTLVGSLSEEDDHLLLEQLAAANAAPVGGGRPGPDSLLRDADTHALERARGGPGAGDTPRSPSNLPNLLVRDLDESCRPRATSAPLVDPDDGRLPPPSCRSAGGESWRFRTWKDPKGQEWRIVSMRLGAGGRAATAEGPGRFIGALPPSSGSTPAVPTPVVWREALLNQSGDALVLRTYRTRLGSVLVVTLLLAGALGHALARRGLRPLARLAARVELVDANSLDQRLASPEAPAEIQALVRSFDVMLGRLESAFRSLTEYAGHLAHEFRTPIHVLRQQAEVALARERTPAEYQEVLGSTVEDLDRLNRMVDDVLLLARTEDPRAFLALERVSVAAELAAVVDYFEPSAAEAGITLHVNAPPHLELRADRALLRRALVNLVSNALRHTRAGGSIWLAANRTLLGHDPVNGAQADVSQVVRGYGHAAGHGGPARDRDDAPTGAHETASGITVEVRDSGEGIAPEHLAHVFDRHYRAPAARATGSGSGLGLSIVRGIMALHGGTATLTSAPEQGTCVRLGFPEFASIVAERSRSHGR